ncbi:hypothetical protein [Rhodopila sp.]|uniref:hypothetical protein n=1 Tax=Rhodopila sp. TaxID=2480087 RepID=UPI003D0A29E8
MMDKQAMVTARPANPAGSMYPTVRRLGWLSVALGAAALLAPRLLGHSVGLGDRPRTMTAFGLREVGVGIGILASDDPTPWVWARAGGDAMDIAALSAATTNGSTGQARALLGFAVVDGVTVEDVLCAHWLSTFQARRAVPVPDYSSRSGFPRPIADMRGRAKSPAA